MASGNPTLNDQRFADAFAEVQQSYEGPAYTGPRPRRMELDGVVMKAGLLLALLVAAAGVGWALTGTSASGEVELPAWTIVAIIGAFGLAIWTAFKPKTARFTGPAYAVIEGLAIGALSKVFEADYDGIVLQAVGLTVGVFVMMLALYRTGLVRVTPGFRKGIVAATGAIVLVYVFDLGLRIFGSGVPFLHDAGPIGVLVSLVIVGVAAFNLILDFDFVDRATERGAPAYMEWYAAFGLVVTLAWLYIELLRLLSKLRR